MNITKQHKKLAKYYDQAEHCLTREQAQLIIRKSDEAQAKIKVCKILENVLTYCYLWPGYVCTRRDCRNTYTHSLK